jgi:6-hydroxynicotinate reductase
MAETTDKLSLDARSQQFGAAEGDSIVRCDACLVLCRYSALRPHRSLATAWARLNGIVARVEAS